MSFLPLEFSLSFRDISFVHADSQFHYFDASSLSIFATPFQLRFHIFIFFTIFFFISSFFFLFLLVFSRVSLSFSSSFSLFIAFSDIFSHFSHTALVTGFHYYWPFSRYFSVILSAFSSPFQFFDFIYARGFPLPCHAAYFESWLPDIIAAISCHHAFHPASLAFQS
jgi:hypothetical protein